MRRSGGNARPPAAYYVIMYCVHACPGVDGVGAIRKWERQGGLRHADPTRDTSPPKLKKKESQTSMSIPEMFAPALAGADGWSTICWVL